MSEEITFTDNFKKGMKIGKEVHKDFELRQMTTEDMLDAELQVSAAAPMNFKAELAVRQLVRVGTFSGPFTIKMVRNLDPLDFNKLTDGLNKVAHLGEEESPQEPID